MRGMLKMSKHDKFILMSMETILKDAVSAMRLHYTVNFFKNDRISRTENEMYCMGNSNK